MKTAAIFAALVMLASSENISRADDYFSGYVDLSHLHERVTGEDGAGHFSDSINLNTLGGTIQYRLDNCAVGLKISGTSYHYSFTSSSDTSTTIGAEAGYRVKNLWIVGLGRFTSFDDADAASEYKKGAYGIGLYYIFNDQYRLGFAAEQQESSFSTSDFSFNDQWMTYAIKSKYFVSDDLMLSSSLGPVDKVDSQISGIMIQDCFLGGGFGSWRLDGRRMADCGDAFTYGAWTKVSSRPR